MEINISSKLLENIIGKIDTFGLAKLIKTGQTLEGRVLSIKGDTLIVDFGKGPVVAKTQLKLQKGDLIRVVVKDIKDDTLILRLIERREGIVEKNIEREIANQFPHLTKEEVETVKSFIKHNIPLTQKNIENVREIIEKEKVFKELLEKLSVEKNEEIKTSLRQKLKDILKDLSRGYLIEKKEGYELTFIFPYINEKRELIFQRIVIKYKKKKGSKKSYGKEEKIRFSLSLSKLGPLKVDMSFEGKNIDTHIFTSSQKINSYIDQNIEDLKEGLFHIGFLLRKISFDLLKMEDMEDIDRDYKKIVKGIDIKI